MRTAGYFTVALVVLASLLGTITHAAPTRIVERTGQNVQRLVAYFVYYHVNENSGPYTPLLPIIQDNSEITTLILGFVDLQTSGPANLTIGGVPPTNSTFLGPLWSEVSQIQKAGVPVTASFGGYLSNDFILLQQDFNKWYPVLKNFITKYALSGLDLDVEPGPDGTTTPSLASVVQLIKQLNSDFGDGFIITLAPVASDLQQDKPGFSGFNYKTLDNQCVTSSGKKIVNWYNAQFYGDDGKICNEPAQYESIISNGWDPERVIMLVPGGDSDAGADDYCSLASVESTATTLAKKYSNFGGMGESGIWVVVSDADTYGSGGYDWTMAGTSENPSIGRAAWFQGIGNAMSSA